MTIVNGRICLVDGCVEKHPQFRICTRHWNKLPAALKKKWWDETNYGTGTPNAELIKEVNEVYRGKVGN